MNQQQLGSAPDEEARSQNKATDQPSSMQPVTATEKHLEDSDEIEEDNLDSLDIPDIPPSPSTFSSVLSRNTTIVQPIRLISTPLPANFVVADALYPIPPPAPALDGRCLSKYVTSTDIDEEHENIEYSRYWNNNRDDPIFADRPSDESTTSLEDLLTLVKQRYVDGEARHESRKSRSSSHSNSVRRESIDKASALASIEQNLAAEKAKLATRLAELERRKNLQNGKHALSPQAASGSPPIDKHVTPQQEQQSQPQPVIFKKPMTRHEQTEAVLVALGVTGSPKPVDMRPLPPYRGEPRGPPDESLNSADSLPNDHSTNGSTPHQKGHGPPPPPFRQTSYSGGADGSPSSAASSHVNAHSYSANGVDYNDGNTNYATEEPNQSPNESRSGRSGSRKRSFARRGSCSDEEDTPARRQEDDVTPKLKRRQPKVAEAYG